MKLNFNSIKKFPVAALIIAAVTMLSSCDAIYDDLQPCPQGARLRFVYDYNMEFANAFPSQVDCLQVLVYDSDGKYIYSRTENGDVLHDENWRMGIELKPGSYNVIAYGGMGCEDSSFEFVSNPETSLMPDIEVKLKQSALTSPVGTNLHPLFYGRLELTIEESDIEFREATVNMMKDTNNLRVVLQQINGNKIESDLFDFKVTDANTLMNWDNQLLPSPTVDYLPWTKGDTSVGVSEDNDTPFYAAFAEMSFPRLVTTSSPRLEVTRKSDGKKVISIPLINYLMLLKSEAYAKMGDQEFLDRENEWDMVFFLDAGLNWIETTIVINDWVVRINDIDDF